MRPLGREDHAHLLVRLALPEDILALLVVRLDHRARELDDLLVGERIEELDGAQPREELRLIELVLVGDHVLELAADGALERLTRDAPERAFE